jgi:hypothetical protein
MKKKKIVLLLFALSVFFVLSQGCYKVTTIIVGGEEVTDEVSFNTNILPVFNNSCNISGCHSAGGIKPDLSESNAFNTLNNGGYLNTGDPEQSEIYQWITGKRSVEMPPGGPSNPSNVNNLILAWIKQGASNN